MHINIFITIITNVYLFEFIHKFQIPLKTFKKILNEYLILLFSRHSGIVKPRKTKQNKGQRKPIGAGLNNCWDGMNSFLVAQPGLNREG